MNSNHGKSATSQIAAGRLISSVIFSGLLVLLVIAGPVLSQESGGHMNNQRLGKIIKRPDTSATGQSGHWQLSIDGIKLRVITDERANRMRIMSPIASAKALSSKRLYRLMQANFDSALDARYAVAKGALWSAFIHPMRSLSDREFISGVGQVVNLSQTYGRSYTSGALVFRGGDSETLQKRKLIDRLLKKGMVL